MKDFFPLDIAYDDAFFDRDSERQRLTHNISVNTHTLINSPRRYGKTSLVLKVMADLDVACAQMDMMVAADPEKMQGVILNGIGQVISQVVPSKSKLMTLVRTIFQPFNTIETFELGSLKIKFQPYAAKSSELIVLEALERLEALLEKLDRRVVLFFDEYQHVLSIRNAIEFENSLRSFAQKSKYVTFIFSGSNRHILQEMFSDRSRPFYNMCDHIQLGRISQQDYTTHLLQLSKVQWQSSLTPSTLELILELTARHSYYVNALCRRLWINVSIPDGNFVMSEWNKLASEKRYEISNAFESLSPIQRTVLLELAKEPFSHPTSKEVIRRINASLSGISNALAGLIERDYVGKDHTGNYRVLNPLMEYVLRQYMLRLN